MLRKWFIHWNSVFLLFCSFNIWSTVLLQQSAYLKQKQKQKKSLSEKVRPTIQYWNCSKDFSVLETSVNDRARNVRRLSTAVSEANAVVFQQMIRQRLMVSIPFDVCQTGLLKIAHQIMRHRLFSLQSPDVTTSQCWCH